MSDLTTTTVAEVAGSDSSNLESLCALVGTAAALFYVAESEVNPGVKTYWDAVHYIATSLSVGYANIFPVTQMGKTIGSVVQMLGPALSSKALDGLVNEGGPPPADPALLAKLDSILEELRRLNQPEDRQ